MAKQEKSVRQFRDLGLTFIPHPVTSDVVSKTDAAAVKQSIRNLVLTMNYERPFHSEKGCQVYRLLFENVTQSLLQIARQSVINVINIYEPRANLVDVVVENNLTRNSIDISIYFTLLNIDTIETVNVYIDRLR